MKRDTMATTGGASLLLLSLAALVQLSQAIVPESELFRFGPPAEDSDMPTLDDHFVAVNFTQPFKILGSSQAEVHVSSNGVVSFGSGVIIGSGCDTQKGSTITISPFWADVDISQGLGGAIHYRVSTDKADRTKAEAEIQKAFPDQDVVLIQDMFVATWYETPFYNAKGCVFIGATIPRNSFQLALASGGPSGPTYAILYYNKVQWASADCSGKPRENPELGFDMGDGYGIPSYKLPGSCSPDAINIGETSNVCDPGKWIFRIDQLVEPAYAPCVATTPAPTGPPTPGNVCTGRGTCLCKPGYAGDDCGKVVNWCEQQAIGIEGNPTFHSLCGDRGTCVSTPNGAACECHAGFTGKFCDKLVPSELVLSKRCSVYNNTVVQAGQSSSDQTGCGTGYQCVPDDLQCLLTPCKEPVGWCLPNDKAKAYKIHNVISARNIEKAIYSSRVQTESSASCSGNGQCQCVSGYTGAECENDINWCEQSTPGIGQSTPIKNICGKGTCVSQPSGVTCTCPFGYTGQFCHDVDPNQAHISSRCYAYAPPSTATTTAAIPIGCNDGQTCLPDNLLCLVNQCKNPIGWCLPLDPLDSRSLKMMHAKLANDF